MTVSDTPRVLLVLSSVLGWKTYAGQLTSVARADGARDIHVYRFGPTIVERLVVKRHNRTRRSAYHRFISPIQAFKGIFGRTIRAEIDRVQPDAIHFAAHPAAAAHAFGPSRIPFTVTLDCTQAGMEVLKETKLWTEKDKRDEAELFRRAARIYPWSRWAADSLINDYGIPADRICIIPPSLEMGNAKAPVERTEEGRLPRIIFVGNDFLRKGGDMLHRWVTGPLAGTCELHIVSHDRRAKLVGENVVFHGGVTNSELINELMPRMDLICHPTQFDMSAYVLAEAARAGLPCVASSVGGIPDLVEEGRTGFLVDRRDENGFIARLRTLIADQSLRDRMGAAAYDLAISRFDARKNYEWMLNEIAEIGGGHRSGAHTGGSVFALPSRPILGVSIERKHIKSQTSP